MIEIGNSSFHRHDNEGSVIQKLVRTHQIISSVTGKEYVYLYCCYV